MWTRRFYEDSKCKARRPTLELVMWAAFETEEEDDEGRAQRLPIPHFQIDPSASSSAPPVLTLGMKHKDIWPVFSRDAGGVITMMDRCPWHRAHFSIVLQLLRCLSGWIMSLMTATDSRRIFMGTMMTSSMTSRNSTSTCQKINKQTF